MRIAIDITILTTTRHRTCDAWYSEVRRDIRHVRFRSRCIIIDIHLRLIDNSHVGHCIAVAYLTTCTTKDVTAINILSTDMTARHIDGCLTCTWGKHELIRPTESEAVCLVGVLSCSCSSLRYIQCIPGIRDVTHRSQRTGTIYRASDMTTLDIDKGFTAYHTSLRIVILVALTIRIGIYTTAGTIDVASVNIVFLIERFRTEVPPWVIVASARNLFCNTDGTAIDIHRSIRIVVTILTATIDRTLDERGRQNRAGTFRTDIDNRLVNPSHPQIRVEARTLDVIGGIAVGRITWTGRSYFVCREVNIRVRDITTRPTEHQTVVTTTDTDGTTRNGDIGRTSRCSRAIGCLRIHDISISVVPLVWNTCNRHVGRNTSCTEVECTY